MTTIRTRIQNFSLRMDTLEKKVFWLLAVMTSAFGCVCTVLTVLENLKFPAALAALLCALIPQAAMFLCDKTHNYRLAYSILCISINIVLLPITVFTNGGIHSGMPIFLSGAILLISLVMNSKQRIVMGAITLVVDAAVLITCVYCPDLVTPIPDGMVNFDIIACCLLVSLGELILITMVMNEYKAALLKEKQLNDQKVSLRLEMMEAQNENVEAVRRMRHDARHHNAMILEMLQNQQYEELEKYMRQKMGDDEQYSTVIYCMNSIINSILSVYTRRAKKAGISVEIHAEAPPEMIVSEPEMVAMLSNIYENAIHGAQSSGKDEKKILIVIHPKDERLVIRCTNTCEDSLELFNGFPGPGPGTGIKSILEASKAYDGQLMYGIDHGELICRLVVNIRE